MTNLIDEKQAAQYLCLSRSFLRAARVKGTGPQFLKLGRAVRYKIEDLDNWLEGKARKNTINLQPRRLEVDRRTEV
jgi:predicted DNA-binding transcriptional regulator AlpA